MLCGRGSLNLIFAILSQSIVRGLGLSLSITSPRLPSGGLVAYYALLLYNVSILP